MTKSKISEISEQIRGVSYKPEDIHDNLNENSIPLLRANNIFDGGINFDDVVYVDKSKVSKKQLLKMGDVLVCASSGSKHLVGKAAQVDFDGEYTFGAFCKVVRPIKIIHEYLGMYFQSSEYRKLISAVSQGANINNIKNENIDNLLISVPSSHEQKNISEILTKVLDIIKLRKKQINSLDNIIKSRFVEIFGQEKYQMVKTKDICGFITKGTTPKTNEIVEEHVESFVPYLKVYNLSFDGKMLFDVKPQFIAPAIHHGGLARSKVYPNDVLMNIVGPPLGKFAIVPDTYQEWNINQAIAIFRATDKVIPRFLLYALMQPKVLQPFIDSAVGIRQQNLSLEQCRNIEIPLPPLEIQKQFVNFAKQVDKLKIEVQKSLDETQGLFDSLMQKYFE